MKYQGAGPMTGDLPLFIYQEDSRSRADSWHSAPFYIRVRMIEWNGTSMKDNLRRHARFFETFLTCKRDHKMKQKTSNKES